MSPLPTPVLFIHGLWLHARSWQPWIDRFAEAGYPASAPPWPGEPDSIETARAEPDALTMPDKVTKSTLKRYGHSPDVADACLSWLREQGL